MENQVEELKEFIIKCLAEKKAEDIRFLSLPDTVGFANCMIFASGKSVKNITAIAEYTALELKHQLKQATSIEGSGYSDWVLLDANEIIVHLFCAHARENLQLEKLWHEKITTQT